MKDRVFTFGVYFRPDVFHHIVKHHNISGSGYSVRFLKNVFRVYAEQPAHPFYPQPSPLSVVLPIPGRFEPSYILRGNSSCLFQELSFLSGFYLTAP